MSKVLLPILSLLTLLSLGTSRASAQILYDNGAPAYGAPGVGNTDGIGFFADAGDPDFTEVGDVFTATTSGTAGEISFSGIYYGSANPPGVPPTVGDTFTISLYSVSDGAPDTSVSHLTSSLSDVTSTYLGQGRTRSIYEFSGQLNTPFTLTAGTVYYLGISDLTNGYDDFAVSQTSNAVSNDGFSLVAGTTSTFVNTLNTSDPAPAPLSFSLSVPEPSTWGLGLLGGIALLVLRRAARRSA